MFYTKSTLPEFIRGGGGLFFFKTAKMQLVLTFFIQLQRTILGSYPAYKIQTKSESYRKPLNMV